MPFRFATLDEHHQETKVLETRMKKESNYSRYTETHSFVPLSTNAVEVKQYSNSNTSRIEKVNLWRLLTISHLLPSVDMLQFYTMDPVGSDIFLEARNQTV